MDLEKYNYTLPEKLIRKIPLQNRDQSRLFIYDTKSDKVTFDIFENISDYLPQDSLLVRNTTKVLPVRLHLRKATGGKIEVFVLMNEYSGGKEVPAICDRKLSLGDKVYISDDIYFETVRQDGPTFYFKTSFDISKLEDILNAFGNTPIPHYLEGAEKIDEEDLRQRYQTVFASSGASTAAPTASLHFTDGVFEKIKNKNISLCDVLLNVGLGTFANLKPEHFESGKLHREFFEVSDMAAQELFAAKGGSQKIVAVGTTAMRTLESWKHSEEFVEYKGASGDTQIFIYPPYADFFADALVTNFHLPKTSLMLLVQAFLESKGSKKDINELYNIAIKEEFAFYSFGDAMLIL